MIYNYTDPKTKEKFVMRPIGPEAIVEFLEQQTSYHFHEGTQDGNSCYLIYNQNLIDSSQHYGVYKDDELVTFAMLGSKAPVNLIRIYTKPDFRQRGLGAMVIEQLQVESLGCLKDNVKALALYERLGFESDNDSGVVISLKKKSMKTKIIYRYSIHSGYECSSKGDKRFSAFYARLEDGRTIEQHYQCDVKAYDPGGTNWRLGKGKPPLTPTDHETLYKRYLVLWKRWATEHQAEMDELRSLARENNCVLRDSFATSNVNQARALAQILNETEPT